MWKKVLIRVGLGLLGLVVGFGLGVGGLGIAGGMGVFEFQIMGPGENRGVIWLPITLIGFPILGAVLGVFVRHLYWVWIAWIIITVVWFSILLLVKTPSQTGSEIPRVKTFGMMNSTARSGLQLPTQSVGSLIM